jgi:hypothetical protein
MMMIMMMMKKKNKKMMMMIILRRISRYNLHRKVKNKFMSKDRMN